MVDFVVESTYYSDSEEKTNKTKGPQERIVKALFTLKSDKR